MIERGAGEGHPQSEPTEKGARRVVLWLDARTRSTEGGARISWRLGGPLSRRGTSRDKTLKLSKNWGEKGNGKRCSGKGP